MKHTEGEAHLSGCKDHPQLVTLIATSQHQPELQTHSEKQRKGTSGESIDQTGINKADRLGGEGWREGLQKQCRLETREVYAV